jgi:hypothetical protein
MANVITTVENKHQLLVEAVQKFRKVVREYKPCGDCGTGWCMDMAELLVTTEGLVEDVATEEELAALASTESQVS